MMILTRRFNVCRNEVQKLYHIQNREYSKHKTGILYKLFTKNLLLTNSLSSGIFMAVGDLIQQEYEYQNDLLLKRYDWARSCKLNVDHLLISPITLASFFYGTCMLEGRSITQSTEELKAKFLFVYKGDWLYWPPVQFYNFYYLPTRYRVFYVNCAAMIYNIFLSYSKHLYKR